MCGCVADEDKDNNTITGIGLYSKAEFSKCCDAQISAAGSVEELCRGMAREERNKTTTQVVGGTVTAAPYAAEISTRSCNFSRCRHFHVRDRHPHWARYIYYCD